MPDATFAMIKPYSFNDWERRQFGWFAIPKDGADFRLFIGENIEVNGDKMLKENIADWTKKEWATGMHTEAMRHLKNLVDKVESIQISLCYSSNNNHIKINHIEGYPPSDYPGLIKDIYFKNAFAASYYNINFFGTDEQITQAQVWKNEGKCPSCGEMSKFTRTSLICSKHGIYGGF